MNIDIHVRETHAGTAITTALAEAEMLKKVLMEINGLQGGLKGAGGTGSTGGGVSGGAGPRQVGDAGKTDEERWNSLSSQRTVARVRNLQEQVGVSRTQALEAERNRFERASREADQIHARQEKELRQHNERIAKQRETVEREEGQGIRRKLRMMRNSNALEERRQAGIDSRASRWMSSSARDIGSGVRDAESLGSRVENWAARNASEMNKGWAETEAHNRSLQALTRVNNDVIRQRISEGHTLQSAIKAEGLVGEHANQVAREYRSYQNALRDSAATARRPNSEQPSNFDRLLAGGILWGAAQKVEQAGAWGLQQYGNFQLAEIQTQSVNGMTAAPAVMEQARQDSLNIYGGSYRDVLMGQAKFQQQGVDYETARKEFKALSDINAGSGGDIGRMNRAVYNMAQIEAQGRPTRLDIRQFEQALIPISSALTKYLGISRQELSERITAGKVSNVDVRNALFQLAETGPYKDIGKRISNETVPGMWEKTMEEMEKTGEVMGKTLFPAFQTFNHFLEGTFKFLANQPSLTAGLTTGVAGLGVVAGGLGAYNLFLSGVGVLRGVLPGFGAGANRFGVSVGLFSAAVNRFAGGSVVGAAGAAGAAPGVVGGGGFGSWMTTAPSPFRYRGSIDSRLLQMSSASPLQATALGAVSGVSAYNNYQKAGYTDAQSMGASMATGLTLGLAAYFVPGGPFAILVGQALAYTFNNFWNPITGMGGNVGAEAAAEAGDAGSQISEGTIAGQQGAQFSNLTKATAKREAAERQRNIADKALRDKVNEFNKRYGLHAGVDKDGTVYWGTVRVFMGDSEAAIGDVDEIKSMALSRKTWARAADPSNMDKYVQNELANEFDGTAKGTRQPGSSSTRVGIPVVKGVTPGRNGEMKVELTIPLHPSVKQMVQDHQNASSP